MKVTVHDHVIIGVQGRSSVRHFVKHLMSFTVLVLTACSANPMDWNIFEVDDPNGLVRSATLELCGSETPLKRADASFKLTKSIRCEGDGQVLLIYREGSAQHCVVGYVTPHMRQDFHFRAERSSCEPIGQTV
jgi:hypothetical protein